MKIYLIRLKNILRFRYLFKILLVLSLVYIFLFIKFDKKESVYTDLDNEFIGIVTSYKYDNERYTIYLKSAEELIVYFDVITKLDIKYGDKLQVNGSISKPKNNTIPNLFNYKKYLERKKIYNIVYADSVKKISNNENIIYYIKNKLIERIDNIPKSKMYIKAFVLGLKDEINKDVLSSYSENGISHLFAISGMHISLFSMVIFFFIKKISYNNYYNYLVVLTFLILYMLILDSPISVVRTIVMFIIFAINKLFNLKISRVDLMILVFIVISLFDPYVIYEISFQFSYVISFFLVVFNKKINNSKNKKLYMSFICFLVSFPIVIYNFYQVSLISILLNLFMIPFVSIIIFPLSIITLIFPFLDNLLYIFIKILESVSLFINEFDIFKLQLSKPNLILVIIYYILIILSIYNRKYLVLFILTIIIHKNYTYFDNNLNVLYLDVNQGDSTLITYKNNTILIDTGGSYFYDNMSLSRTIPYLKSIGRNKINYLILTHGDYDHMGESINLIENFKVEKVIFNCGEFNDLEKELIKVLEKKKIKYYSCIKELNIDNSKLYFLQTKEYDNENDNSNVIYIELDGYKFMLMGDSGIEKEKDILDKYNICDIDVLKVGHHGSKTSSDKKFIDEIKPKYSIISVGKNNRYGHPNKEVLDTLNDSKIYRTDQDGSIMFKIKKDKLQIETCSP